jgi:hypothetical protein
VVFVDPPHPDDTAPKEDVLTRAEKKYLQGCYQGILKVVIVAVGSGHEEGFLM